MIWIEPDFDNFVEAVVEMETARREPESFIIYETDKDGKYFPSFIRYGERVINPGAKVNIEVTENGYIVQSGKKKFICQNDDWCLNQTVDDQVKHTVEKERQLTEDEIFDLEVLTSRINEHFASQ